jgi:FADH2-dependent halogenase
VNKPRAGLPRRTGSIFIVIMDSSPEVVILGGGPGGSAAATCLARAGRRVLLLEKERFPRFHIGESLLPYNRRLFEELGLAEKLDSAGFIVKTGAQFHSGNGRHFTQFIFRQGRFTRETAAYQVERAHFDHLLLNHARGCGVDVREGWTVRRVVQGDWPTVEVNDPNQQTHAIRVPFVIDATGQANLTGTQEGIKAIVPHHRKLAVFAHFAGVRLDAGERGGDTLIVRLENKWFWLIPLAPDKVSVGCVIDKDEFARSKRPGAELLGQIVEETPAVRERMTNARAVSPVQTLTDFSYYNRRLVGPRLARVGDAAGFMDPIFSAGVYLAMHSGKLAAEAIAAALAAGDDGALGLKRYERRVWAGMRSYWRMVDAFYTRPFMDLFFAPSERFQLTSAVNAILAGELEGGFRLRWRLQLFFFIVRMQRYWPVAPVCTLE